MCVGVERKDKKEAQGVLDAGWRDTRHEDVRNGIRAPLKNQSKYAAARRRGREADERLIRRRRRGPDAAREITRLTKTPGAGIAFFSVRFYIPCAHRTDVVSEVRDIRNLNAAGCSRIYCSGVVFYFLFNRRLRVFVCFCIYFGRSVNLDWFNLEG